MSRGWLPVTRRPGAAGEMQGTVHRLLLEERQGQLKPGAVLLLKQVWGAGHSRSTLGAVPATGTARSRCPRAGSELRPRPPAALSSQVGVFSPSHRNHYLNVTPANLLRIYPPEPEGSLSQPEVRRRGAPGLRGVRGDRAQAPGGSAGWINPPVGSPRV